MIDISAALHRSCLEEAKSKVEQIISSEKSSYDEIELSKYLFRIPLDRTKEESIKAHLQAIHTQLNKIFGDEADHLKKEAIYLEFSKGITLFDRLTRILGMKNGAFGDNFIASQNFYLDAVKSYKECVPIFYQGDLEFSLIPLKIRLAIEIYFKNMIGYIESKETKLTVKSKGKVDEYPLSISEILRFFSHKKYNKYANLPINLDVLRNINYWSNNLVHTGVVSFPWQNLTAIDLLRPLFHTQHENGTIHIEGFNYLNLDYSQEDLVKDLNTFLSNKYKSIEVKTSERSKKPIEGAFYYLKS